MLKISAFIITFNEEQNIRRAIESLQNVVDEIIIVDSFSKDATVDIAKSYGVKVFERAFNGFGDQKFFANEQAQYDWVINIDADESLTPELQQHILEFKKSEPQFSAYRLNVLTNFCGQWIKHSGWYPEFKIRLWNKQKGFHNQLEVHEEFQLDNPKDIGKLKGDVLHYSFPNLSYITRKLEFYTELGANDAMKKGRKISFLQILLVPKWVFIKSYIIKLGFLDGYYGYIIAKFAAITTFIKYSKIRQKHQALKNK